MGATPSSHCPVWGSVQPSSAGLPGSQIFNLSPVSNTLTAWLWPNEETTRDIYKTSYDYFSFQWRLELLGGMDCAPGIGQDIRLSGWRRGLRYTEIRISKKKKATPLTAWKVSGTHGSLFYNLKRKGVLSAPKCPHRCHSSQFESPWTSKRSWS